MIGKLRIPAAFGLCLAMLVLGGANSCNQPWNITTADSIDAVVPTIDALNTLFPSPYLTASSAALKTLSAVFRTWDGSAGAYTNATNVLNKVVADLNSLAPQLSPQQKVLAVIIAGGVSSVLVVLKAHAPAGMTSIALERTPATNNLGPLPTFKTASEYKKAWKKAGGK